MFFEVVSIFKQNPFLSFREIRSKEDIQFGDNGTTVSATSNKAYVFLRDQSVGDPKVDSIRTLNIPAVVSILSTIIVDIRRQETLS